MRLSPDNHEHWILQAKTTLNEDRCFPQICTSLHKRIENLIWVCLALLNASSLHSSTPFLHLVCNRTSVWFGLIIFAKKITVCPFKSKVQDALLPRTAAAVSLSHKQCMPGNVLFVRPTERNGKMLDQGSLLRAFSRFGLVSSIG